MTPVESRNGAKLFGLSLHCFAKHFRMAPPSSFSSVAGIQKALNSANPNFRGASLALSRWEPRLLNQSLPLSESEPQWMVVASRRKHAHQSRRPQFHHCRPNRGKNETHGTSNVETCPLDTCGPLEEPSLHSLADEPQVSCTPTQLPSVIACLPPSVPVAEPPDAGRRLPLSEAEPPDVGPSFSLAADEPPDTGPPNPLPEVSQSSDCLPSSLPTGKPSLPSLQPLVRSSILGPHALPLDTPKSLSGISPSVKRSSFPSPLPIISFDAFSGLQTCRLQTT
ncbi:hypothetical protein AMTR_s00093p00105300, partial [Amborella trichopoda]